MEGTSTESVRLLFLDVDGVMTDGRILMGEDGRELKSFNVKDGLGLKILQGAGVEVVIVSSRSSSSVLRRAQELGIVAVHQGVADKAGLCRDVMAERGLSREQAASMGDDLPDLAMFQVTGVRIAPADAAEDVRRAAHYVTSRNGGEGAVREACEWLLRARGKWPQAPGAQPGE
jgi:3-deoxy-D-manno-octulosonate 8-phosphate phosphatase (KDO 8-P phosphatase)